MELMAGPGEIGGALLVLLLAIVIAIFVDDDDLPGPRLCRVEVSGS
jgi:hypothetical protein